MPSAFSTALSGLRAHSAAVEVIANNLANLNTFAYKNSRVEFRDLFYQLIGQSRSGVASQVGLGVAPITTSRQFAQGTVQNTGGVLDAAIQGDGFFVVKDQDLTLYTRAGNFQLDVAKQLVTINGEVLQGWVRDLSTGTINTGLPMRDIVLSGSDSLPPAPTSEMTITANLSGGATIGDIFTVPIQVFDSRGESHILTARFTSVAASPSAAASWEVQMEIPAADVGGAAPVAPSVGPNILVGGPVTIDFNSQGVMINPNAPPSTAPYDLIIDMATVVPPQVFVNGASPLNATWRLFPAGQPTLTNFASDSAVFDIFQDGTPPAELTSISIVDDGLISGFYSDGRTLRLAQLALASFTNPQSLLALANNTFVPTSASGIPINGTSNSGGLGSVLGQVLEFSNVDIAQEFTNLLTFQRGFQANSRVITTADELNQEALNLKR